MHESMEWFDCWPGLASTQLIFPTPVLRHMVQRRRLDYLCSELPNASLWNHQQLMALAHAKAPRLAQDISECFSHYAGAAWLQDGVCIVQTVGSWAAATSVAYVSSLMNGFSSQIPAGSGED